MIKRIQVFGLQCSGTNVLRNLLQQNFGLPVCETYGSKHGVEKSIEWEKIEQDKEEVLFVHIYKNVLAWTVSMRDNPHGAIPIRLPLIKFIKHEWKPKGVKSFPNVYEYSYRLQHHNREMGNHPQYYR